MGRNNPTTARVRADRRATSGIRHLALALAAGVMAIPAVAQAAPPAAASVERVLAAEASGELRAFYQARQHQPLWIARGGLRPEADEVVRLIGSAADDGLSAASYDVDDLERAVAAARTGDPAALGRAELKLSRAFSAYVRDLRTPRAVRMDYVDAQLRPAPITAQMVLSQLDAAPSLRRGVADAVRMNPLYERMKRAFAAHRATASITRSDEDLLRANLERARALPRELGARFVLVDAAAQRLWMYENGEAVGSMRVVVGRPGEETPNMAAFIRFVTLNPYWNLPPDLAQRIVAPQVLRQGPQYLRRARYQVLSGWSEGAEPLDPATVNWQAVAAGRTELAVRQLPGPANSMGRMKFMFPNDRGIYLHDTPNKDLFGREDRRQSAGCVRLENAPALARWLLGHAPRAASSDPEHNIDLADPVPVYITYFTAAADGEQVAFRDDIYGRDRVLLAQLNGGWADARR